MLNSFVELSKKKKSRAGETKRKITEILLQLQNGILFMKTMCY